jgi:hypothetical protein
MWNWFIPYINQDILDPGHPLADARFREMNALDLCREGVMKIIERQLYGAVMGVILIMSGFIGLFIFRLYSFGGRAVCCFAY